MKQSWRPQTSESEGYFFTVGEGSASEFVGTIHQCEEVEIDGEKDETGKLIRQDLKGESPVATALVGEKRLRDDKQEPFFHVEYTTKGEIESFHVGGARELVSRIHTRVLLKSYGWPLKHFCTLRELIRVFEGAIKGVCTRRIPRFSGA